MLDIVAATLLILSFIRGYRKGLVVALFSMAALVIGVVLALKLSGVLAAFLFAQGWVSSGWASLLSYVIIFIGVGYLIRLGGKAIESSMEAISLGWVNRLAGGVLFAFAAAFVWSALLWLADKVGAFSPAAKEASVTYAYLAPIAPWVLDHIGTVLPFVKNMLQDLQDVSDKLTNSIAPAGVDSH